MKKLHYSIFIFILCCFTNIFAQENQPINEKYKVNYDVLKKLCKTKKISNAFHTESIKTVKKIKYKTRKIKNDKYYMLQNEITALEEEKKVLHDQYLVKLKKYNDIDQIVTNIQTFLNSKKTF